MRICFLSRRYFPAVSGMSVYARNMTKALADRGHEIVMISQYREDEKGVGIYGGGPPPDETWMEVDGLRSFGEEQADENTPADFEMDMREMLATAEEYHAKKPFDVVHAQYCYPNGLVALELSRRWNVPNITSIQGGDGHWVGLCCKTHKKAMDAVLQHAMALIIGCESFAKEVSENHNIPLQRFTIIPGATNTKQFQPSQALGNIQNPARLLYHGRVDQRKGVLDFIEAGKLLLDEKINIKLIISGIGPDLEAAKNRVKTLKIDAVTEFLGMVSYKNAHEVYHQGDIFVSPTYAEGFSNTILEAMASGLPIVSTDTVGVKDCVSHGINGMLTQPGAIPALAKVLKELISDEELRRKLAENAKKEVETKYSWPVVAEQLETVYKKISEEKIDTDWLEKYNISDRLEDADLSCRFRKNPHLL
ncbi:glycosyltransferase family 4 protein [Flavimarina sp. Hel_I_48]|uniref:glycosyltransferase family 4 protein n=1 Tax=Flavimarina sp. Hel_I_48 TaxID=1392488 RepID=UPI0004DF4BDA|nr:glycosyltransferase family 4 protein [Flavimarina sp. Hel_I_48]